MKHTRFLLKPLAACAVLALCASPGVRAQSAAAAPAAADPPPVSSDTVVVTARKRIERLQDVPVAVTAFSAAQLEQQQVRSLEDLSLAVPNVYITRTQGSNTTAQIYIRGIGQDDTFANVEPAITMYIDGVPYTKAVGALVDLIEFKSVEVLRGPQGTLYGRNSTGGAVKFETRRPDRERARAVADVTFGSAHRLDFRGSYSTPLDDSLAVKMDVISRADDGYVTDALATPGSGRDVKLNRLDRKAARLALVWDPIERLSVYATADITADRSGAQTGVPTISSAAADNIDGSGAVQRSRPLYGTRSAAPEIRSPNTFDGRGGQVNISYDLQGPLDGVRLTSILAHRSFDLDQAIDTNAGPAASGLVTQNGATVSRPSGNNVVRNWHNATLTWELQASSSTPRSPLSWTAGLFMMDESNRSTDYFGPFTTSASGFNIKQTTRSVALFGEASYKVLKDLELSLGGRTTRDTKDFSRSHFAAFGLPVFSGAPYAGDTRVSWSRFTPRVSVAWRATEAVSTYISHSEGFQSGAFQSVPFASAALSNTPFQPVKVKNLEAGLRTQWLDNRLTANLTLFRANYTDLPATVISNAGAFSVLTNDVRITGTELEVSARPVQGLSLYVNGATLRDTYTKSVLAASTIPGAGGRNHVKFTPDITAKVGAQFEAGGPMGGTAFAGANIAYSGEYYMNAVNSPFGYQRPYSVLDANLGFRAAKGAWEATLAAKNLGDRLYASQATTAAGGAVFYGPPRTVSLTLLFRN